MDITVTCQCGRRLRVPEQYAGQSGQCPSCGKVVHLPGLEGSTVPATPPLPPSARVPVPPPLPAQPAQPPPIYNAEIESREVVNHNGQPLPEDIDFFVSAPEEIGPLNSAYSSLRFDTEPMAETSRYLLLTAALLGGFLLGLVVVLLTKSWPALLLAVGLGMLGFCIAWYFTRFVHTCSFVGRYGIADYRCSGSRENITSERIFLFGEAVELRTSQTRHYVNGAYSGTNYSYKWNDDRGRVVFELKGRYHSETGNPKPKDPFHYALAAEIAWSLYLMDSLADELEQTGFIEFGLRGRDWIRVGPGLVVLHRKGETIEFCGEDIARIRIEQGTISIMEPGAKEGWFSSTGVYKFPYQDLGNARFFLFLLDRLVGVR